MSTILSAHMQNLVKNAQGVTSPHIAKVTTQLFICLYAKSFYRSSIDTPKDAYSRMVIHAG